MLSKNKMFPLLILLLTIVSANNFGEPRFLPYAVQWLTQIAIIWMIIINRKKLCPNYKQLTTVSLYLKYVLFISLCGFWVAENYAEYKQLTNGFIGLMMPLYVYLFYNPEMGKAVFKMWYKYAILIFFLFFVWTRNFSQLYFSPLLILFCIFPLIKGRKKYVIIIVCLFYSFLYMEDARMQFIKGSVALLIGLFVVLRKTKFFHLVKLVHFAGYLSVIFLFMFILVDAGSVLTGRAKPTDIEENNKYRDVVYRDTRSLLYVDVVSSAINHNYYLWGHTPARGFEVNLSWPLFISGYEEQNLDVIFNKGERFRNEMVITNVFTWCGLIGLILFSLIYMRASFLAVYKSRNRIIPIIGCFVAFRWSVGWIEDVNTFLISDVDLWFLIAMCMSDKYRNMNEKELILWCNQLIPSFKL